ncbi:hypothetical protein BS47DRAFT_1366792 [Hydnum rufescens UP504]|uniref:Uncharacterized protein n=1 Tax=Hydnum rufescens UP504 TaxID=1448309 RepID=A0A9P6AK61_9AGAM|nr:hypothetical protein BS47DRAFT_1366792 [Hydnum rufescens UP504]
MPITHTYQQTSASIEHFQNLEGAMGEMVGFVPAGYKTIMQAWIIQIEGSVTVLNMWVPECHRNVDLANGGIIDSDIFMFNISNCRRHQHGFNHLSPPFEYQGTNWEYVTDFDSIESGKVGHKGHTE